MAKRIDIPTTSRVGALTQLMELMGRLSDPRAALDLFANGMRAAFGPLAAVHLSTHLLPPGHYRITRLQSADGADRVPQDPPPGRRSTPVVNPVQSGGVLSDLLALGQPCILHDLDLTADPVLGHLLADCRSLVLAPFLDPALPVSWVALLHARPDHFAVADLEALILRANLVGAVFKSLLIGQQLEAANLRIAREIEQIARIQRTLLPAQLPEIPGLAIAAHYETFDRAGGDLYDFARLEGDPDTDRDDRWAILIADASGHGPAAATVCAIVHSILHAYPQEPSGPAELLGHVNRHLCAKQIESSFVTAFLAFYQPSTRELVCARAGHNPPLLLSAPDPATGARRLARTLDAAKGLPLGIDADADFTEERLTLAPGQLALLYTDGIVEAQNAARDQFGIEGIEQALARCDEGAQSAVRCLTQAVARHLGAGKAGDDQTILILEGVPIPPAPASPDVR